MEAINQMRERAGEQLAYSESAFSDEQKELQQARIAAGF
jgi:hypothetical protein